MICTRCLRLRLLPTSSSTSRLTYSTSTSRTPPPPATSTSAAQPFSTPFTPSPYPANSPTHPPKHAPSSIKSSVQQQQPVSSLKAGTVLKGLGFEKNKEPPVAREDWEYPDWLWGLLGQGKEEGGKGGGGGDAFSKSAKQRRLASRLARQGSSSSSQIDLAPEIPIHAQSIDLPAAKEGYKGRDVDVAEVEAARRAREELTGKMREKRRKGIKEGNFLRGMR